MPTPTSSLPVGTVLANGDQIKIVDVSDTTASASGTDKKVALSVLSSFLSGAPAWSSVTGTPTTLAGYGITDAQPLDSDLTAIAALTTTTFGRSLLTQADATAARSTLGLGTAATSASTAFQAADSDLTAIAALTTTTFGRSLLTQADASATRTTLGLGSAATLTAGTSANNAVQLDGSGKLPAVDGSALTNLPGGGTPFDPASPGAIGGTTPSTGAFSALSASASLTAPSLSIGGNQVVSAQQGAITSVTAGSVSGSDTIDVSAVQTQFSAYAAAINNILGAMRSHGLIAN